MIFDNQASFWSSFGFRQETEKALNMRYRMQMITDDKRVKITNALQILGAVYRTSPDDETLKPFFSLIQNHKLSEEWPLGNAEHIDLAQEFMLKDQSLERLKEAYQTLFIGPHHFEAPPWGSVYLDHENVIFGGSVIDLRGFLATHGIRLSTGINEPEDHIGLLLWYASDFIEKEQNPALLELLSEHVLPWSFRYLALLEQHAGHDFYKGIALLTAESLRNLSEIYDVSPASKRLYI